MKKKGTIIFTILGVVLIAIGVTFAIISSPKKSNKEVFTDALENALGLNIDGEANLENKINEITTAVRDNIYKINLDVETTMDEAGVEKANAEIYFGKNELYGKLYTMINDEVKNVEGLYRDNKVYFTVKDVLSKYYYIDIVEKMNELENNISIQDIVKYEKIAENLLTYLKDSLLDAIKEEDIIKSDEKIAINSKDYSSTKYEYSITGNTLYNVIEKFLNKVKNDKDLKELAEVVVKNIVNLKNKKMIAVNDKFEYNDEYDDLDDYDEEYDDAYDEIANIDFDELVNQLLKEAQEAKNIGEIAKIIVYTYKDNTISTQIMVNATLGEQSIPMKVSFDNVIENGLAYRKITFSQAEMEAGYLLINQTSKTNYDIKLVVMMQEMFSGNVTIDGNNMSLNLKTSNALPLSLSVVADIKEDHGTIKLESEGTVVNITFSYEEVSSFPDIDLSNSVSYNEMTDEEKEMVSDIFDFSSIKFGMMGYASNKQSPIEWNTLDDQSSIEWNAFDDEFNNILDFQESIENLDF